MSILGSFRRSRNRANGPAETGRSGRSRHADDPIEWEYGDDPLLHVQPSDIGSYRRPKINSASISPSAVIRTELNPPPAKHRALPQGENLLADAFTGSQAARRVPAVRDALEDALERWWSQQELISPALLRNSLLVLEAGYGLDEAYLSLILRSALQLRKGMITALRHQTDPDRAAYLIKEALLNLDAPLPASLLWRFQREDEESEEWADLLIEDLHQEMQRLGGNQRQLAQVALAQLESETLLTAAAMPQKADAVAGLRLAPGQPILIARPQYWPIGRSLLILLFVVMLASFYLWRQQHSVLGEATLIPTGQYALGGFQPDALSRTVIVDEFTMDRTEVTNGAYRRCYEQGACPKPADVASATHADYFDNPVFERYPVVHVDWQSAAAYCSWAGKRLPTADEWEVAASVAPATARQFRYPWGNLYDARLSNSSLNKAGDTLQVGLHFPFDASPFGLADMAGNVAEWTSTPGRDAYRADSGAAYSAYLVKGGSYIDGPEMLAVDSVREVATGSAEPWLGFRCIQLD